MPYRFPAKVAQSGHHVPPSPVTARYRIPAARSIRSRDDRIAHEDSFAKKGALLAARLPTDDRLAGASASALPVFQRFSSGRGGPEGADLKVSATSTATVPRSCRVPLQSAASRFNGLYASHESTCGRAAHLAPQNVLLHPEPSANTLTTGHAIADHRDDVPRPGGPTGVALAACTRGSAPPVSILRRPPIPHVRTTRDNTLRGTSTDPPRAMCESESARDDLRRSCPFIRKGARHGDLRQFARVSVLMSGRRCRMRYYDVLSVAVHESMSAERRRSTNFTRR